MTEKILAGIGFIACVIVWIAVALGPERRHALRGWPGALWRRLRMGRQARREAAIAIDRARRKQVVDREGNVYRPKSFDRRDGGDRG